MKQSVFAFIVFLLIGCSAGNSGENGDVQSDSTTHESADSLQEEDVELASDTLLTYLQTRAEQLESAAKLNRAQYFYISSSFNGYENSSDATWYFDQEFDLQYCEVAWNMEGTSGSYTYVFDHGSLVGGIEENQYNDYLENVWFAKSDTEASGFSRTEGSDSDGQTNLLSEADFTSKQSDAQMEYDKLIARIRELSDSTSVEDDEVVIHVENIVNYGEDFTETEEYRISKALFEKLIKEE